MRITITESHKVNQKYFDNPVFDGRFVYASNTLVCIFTKEYGYMNIPFDEIESINSTDNLELISVLGQMKNFNLFGEIKIMANEIL